MTIAGCSSGLTDHKPEVFPQIRAAFCRLSIIRGNRRATLRRFICSPRQDRPPASSRAVTNRACKRKIVMLTFVAPTSFHPYS
jgi:hypothetical protein